MGSTKPAYMLAYISMFCSQHLQGAPQKCSHCHDEERDTKDEEHMTFHQQFGSYFPTAAGDGFPSAAGDKTKAQHLKLMTKQSPKHHQ
jgi:hypothetical protein